MRSRIGVLAAVALVLTLTACSSESSGGDAGEVPDRPTTTLTPSESGGSETTTVALFFTLGETVDRVERSVPKVARIGAEAMKALVAGPTADEQRNGYGTAIPAGTRFNGLTIDGGLARVDLSRAFESGGGLGLNLRLAQVACTLSSFATVEGVRFVLDGQLVNVLSGDGVVVDRPVTCDDYRDVLAGAGPGTARPPVVFAGMWPFSSPSEVIAYERGSDQAFRDPVATARAFADRYLGITDPATFPFRPTGRGTGEVPVGFRLGEGGRTLPNPQPTTIIQMSQFATVGASGPWTVTGATSPDIEVDAPTVAARVTSPIALSGRARAFEGNVTVEVREDGMVFGQSLGRTTVTGRGDGVLGPFQGSVSYRTPSRPGGAVVFFERSVADGGSPVLRAAVVRVAFAT